MENNQSNNRVFKGIVTSDKMNKTIVVKVSRLKKHEKYKKYFKASTKFKVHDENNEYHTGDKVVFKETNPISKEKRWIVVSLDK